MSSVTKDSLITVLTGYGMLDPDNDAQALHMQGIASDFCYFCNEAHAAYLEGVSGDL